MMLAIRALTWEILARHRWIMGASAVWLLVACLIAAVLPESARIPEIGTLLLAPMTLGVVLFIATVSHGYDTRLETRAGAFPRRLLRLPVSAILLGGVPLTLAVVGFMLLASLNLLKLFLYILLLAGLFLRFRTPTLDEMTHARILQKWGSMKDDPRHLTGLE